MYTYTHLYYIMPHVAYPLSGVVERCVYIYTHKQTRICVHVSIAGKPSKTPEGLPDSRTLQQRSMVDTCRPHLCNTCRCRFTIPVVMLAGVRYICIHTYTTQCLYIMCIFMRIVTSKEVYKVRIYIHTQPISYVYIRLSSLPNQLETTEVAPNSRRPQQCSMLDTYRP